MGRFVRFGAAHLNIVGLRKLPLQAAERADLFKEAGGIPKGIQAFNLWVLPLGIKFAELYQVC